MPNTKIEMKYNKIMRVEGLDELALLDVHALELTVMLPPDAGDAGVLPAQSVVPEIDALAALGDDAEVGPTAGAAVRDQRVSVVVVAAAETARHDDEDQGANADSPTHGKQPSLEPSSIRERGQVPQPAPPPQPQVSQAPSPEPQGGPEEEKQESGSSLGRDLLMIGVGFGGGVLACVLVGVIRSRPKSKKRRLM